MAAVHFHAPPFGPAGAAGIVISRAVGRDLFSGFALARLYALLNAGERAGPDPRPGAPRSTAQVRFLALELHRVDLARTRARRRRRPRPGGNPSLRQAPRWRLTRESGGLSQPIGRSQFRRLGSDQRSSHRRHVRPHSCFAVRPGRCLWSLAAGLQLGVRAQRAGHRGRRTGQRQIGPPSWSAPAADPGAGRWPRPRAGPAAGPCSPGPAWRSWPRRYSLWSPLSGSS